MKNVDTGGVRITSRGKEIRRTKCLGKPEEKGQCAESEQSGRILVVTEYCESR